MSGNDRKGPVAKLRLTPTVAQRRIRAAAEDSTNVVITEHAKERMQQRGIVVRDVLTVLRTGFVDSDPIPARAGEWKCKVTKKLAMGARTTGVVTVIAVNSRLIVLTVEWEDEK